MAGPLVDSVVQLSGMGIAVGEGVSVGGAKMIKGGYDGVGVAGAQETSQIVRVMIIRYLIFFILILSI